MMNNDLGMSAHLEHSGIFRDNEVLSSSYSTRFVLVSVRSLAVVGNIVSG